MGRGLFVKKSVAAGAMICEYTGNRVSELQYRVMQAALDNFNVEREGLVYIADVDGVVDPKSCGNDSKYVNQSC